MGATLLTFVALATVIGCRGGSERSRAAGSAVWMDGVAEPLAVADLARLEAGGIGEMFVEAAQLDWQGAQPQVAPLRIARQPRRVKATLVLRGAWPLGPVDAKVAARTIATALEAAARTAEEAQLGVAGWHLDLTGVPGKDGAALARALREEIEPSLLLSATLPRDAVAAEGIDELTSATDFVVSFLYGVREGEADEDAAWDFQRVEAAAKKLETLEEPFLVGVVVRGSATLLRAGAEAGELPGVSLADLAWNRRLRVRHGFSLEGIDRQVYAFSADLATHAGDTPLLVGDNVRVVSTSTAHLQELRRQVAGWKLPHCLGELYYRLPHAGEALTLGAASLARIGGDEAALPVPRIVVAKLGASPGRVTVRITLENASTEPSDLGQVDSNFVELWAQGGVFGDVQPGQFYRYDVYVPTQNGQLVRSIRNPTVMRLFAPLLPAGAVLSSGPIELRTVQAGLTDLQVRASFLAPYGGTAEMKPASWTQLQPAPAATPTPPSKPLPRPARPR
ncbi:MAG TPA: hypothetical protein VGS57_08800 [Thermoanaerobaculia bacterium]|jgi:hypothetical protein|nr:hypothetical protein [Thermoanaerobaculia bacterium]